MCIFVSLVAKKNTLCTLAGCKQQPSERKACSELEQTFVQLAPSLLVSASYIVLMCKGYYIVAKILKFNFKKHWLLHSLDTTSGTVNIKDHSLCRH